MTFLLEKTTPGEESLWAVSWASFLTIVLSISLFVLSFVPQSLNVPFATFTFEIIQMQSTRLQFFFYLGLLSLIGLFSLLGLLYPSARFYRVPLKHHYLLIVMILCSLGFGPKLPRGFLWGAGITAFFFLVIQLQVCRASISSIFNHPRFRFYCFGAVFLAVILYSVLFFLWPFTIPLCISDPEIYFFGFENHYAVSVLPGFQAALAEGIGLDPISQTTYGLGVPLLMAYALKLFSLLGLGIWNLVLGVKCFQLTAYLLMAAILMYINRSAAIYTIAGTWMALINLAGAILCPNQSGIRYIPFLLGIFLIAIQSKKEKLSLYLLGALGALFIVLNPETGMAVFAGIAVLVILKSYTLLDPWRSIGVSLGKLSFFFSISALFWFFVFVKPFYQSPPESLWGFFKISLQGFGGLVQKPHLICVLGFFLATTALLQGILEAREGKHSWVTLYRASVGTTMLVWMFYYINRMDSWNLWFQIVLMGFLMAPLWTFEGVKQLFQKNKSARTLLQLIFLCFLGGQLSYSWGVLIKDRKQTLHDLKECSVLLPNGVAVPPMMAQEIRAQMALLPSQKYQKDILIISGLATSLRLAGWNHKAPWYDIACNVLYEKDADRLIAWFDSHGPQWIYADSPDSISGKANPLICSYFLALLGRTKTYRLVERNEGWFIFQRISS